MSSVKSTSELDQLRITYKAATDEWVNAIRAEEALATADHSIREMEKWDDAHFRKEDAHKAAVETRDAYKDGLRKLNEGF